MFKNNILFIFLISISVYRSFLKGIKTEDSCWSIYYFRSCTSKTDVMDLIFFLFYYGCFITLKENTFNNFFCFICWPQPRCFKLIFGKTFFDTLFFFVN